jgi:hypothetical protein
MHIRVTVLYIEPVFIYIKLNLLATMLAIVLFPDPAGPSIATDIFKDFTPPFLKVKKFILYIFYKKR